MVAAGANRPIGVLWVAGRNTAEGTTCLRRVELPQSVSQEGKAGGATAALSAPEA